MEKHIHLHPLNLATLQQFQLLLAVRTTALETAPASTANVSATMAGVVLLATNFLAILLVVPVTGFATMAPAFATLAGSARAARRTPALTTATTTVCVRTTLVYAIRDGQAPIAASVR